MSQDAQTWTDEERTAFDLAVNELAVNTLGERFFTDVRLVMKPFMGFSTSQVDLADLEGLALIAFRLIPSESELNARLMRLRCLLPEETSECGELRRLEQHLLCLRPLLWKLRLKEEGENALHGQITVDEDDDGNETLARWPSREEMAEFLVSAEHEARAAGHRPPGELPDGDESR